jgi:nitrite reductase (NADH) large subunit
MGLDHVKEVLVNEETRKELNERMNQTLKKYTDPWDEAIQNEEIQDKYYAKHTIMVGSDRK